MTAEDDDEFALIERYFVRDGLSTGPEVTLGPGDDCALLDLPPDTELCISVDTLLEGTHFPIGAAGDIVAQRAFAASLSDLAAMGATPVGVTLALTLPGIDHAWLAAFSDRLLELVGRHGAPIIGGNLTRGPLSVTVQVMGRVPRGEAIRRSGATAGDDVWVTGTTGDAGAGLARYLRAPAPDDALQARYLAPEPRLAAGRALRGLASAAIDVSDGLLADLGHLAAASGTGAVIETALLPISAVLREADDDAVGLALTAGDDYELVFTAPPGARDTILRTADIDATRIGRLVPEAGVVALDEAGEPLVLRRTGYNHF